MALLLAVRLIRGESPRLAVATVQYDKAWVFWDIGYFGVAVTVGLVNHSTTGNGVRAVELLAMSDDRTVQLQPPVKVSRGGDGEQDFYIRVPGPYADAPPDYELSDLPEPVSAMSVVRLRVFGWGHVVAVFGNTKAQDIFNRRREPEAPSEYRVRVKVQDVHGKWHEGPAETQEARDS